MKKVTLLFLLMLEISFTAQTKDNFKNLFATENIPSINVSSWFGIPAYFNKEDTEEMFSMSLMQTNPFIMPVYDVESRNLGYISNLQTQLTYLLKAKIIDFVINNKNNKNISDEIKIHFKNKDDFFDSAINKFRKSNINSTGKIELLPLAVAAVMERDTSLDPLIT